MATPLKLLLVEDLEDDALLVLRELRRGGYDITHTRVETAESFTQALDQGRWDAIIADYALPRFDALAAFRLVKQRGLDVPFLIVSGQMGEDTAVAAMKAGVHDFLLKDRLGRLGPAMARELREAGVRAERRGMQEQLLLSDRLASLGLLSASVAHEINNPLASLMANLDFLLEERGERESGPAEGPDSEQEQALIDSRMCADRIREIVRDIKVFSRPEDKQRGPLDVHRVLDSSLRMAWNHVSHRARVIKEYKATSQVIGGEGPLGQIFLNLLINAADAIADGPGTAREIRLVTREEEGTGQVRVEVHDTGRGIPPELRERIFEPFFTTKPVGVGTGLGLSICRRLALELGAHFGVESEMGHGSVFHLLLPRADALEPQPSRELIAPAQPRCVLVLDDDAMVGRALQRLLGTPCDVHVLVQGTTALARVAAGQRFDVILCDLLMPEMDGPQFYEMLLQLAPEQAQRVIFMTGGAITESTRAFLDSTGRPCLDKPIELQKLRARMAALPPLETRVRA
ncbi:hybrid sensor histidine kinase/response regulator [Cystobacter fuscus]|uniref:histidine kinase n=1 Tax=Cystobacter fuscus TaxID=43 RepID=A0A250JJF4_9BACT|nr:response regulator [Cystobacter fuscus]ATB43521.1 hybrid sensor histidine kinase/response regulator [Cystobacter fuscus]